MKLQIVSSKETALIDGYTHVKIEDGKLDLSSIVNNSCVEILANGILDLFSLDQINQVVQAIVSKLRSGGSMVIGGTELDLFAALVNYKEVSLEAANNSIAEVSSMTRHKDVRDVLEQLNMKIFSITLTGVNYEIRATRN